MLKNLKLVSIIVVNYNGKKWLQNLLKTLYTQSYKNFELIIVDNNSTDDSVLFLRKNYPKVKIIINNINNGFSHANNIGYKEAKGEYIYFLNNDTELEKDCLLNLVKYLESDTRVSGLQSKILLLENKSKLDTAGAFLTYTGFLYHNGFGASDSAKYDKTDFIYTAKGASMIFRKSSLEKIKVNNYLFDPLYFAYFEETDLCHRIWINGGIIKYCSTAICYHKMGATSTKLDNNFIQYHSYKNRISTYIKNLNFNNLLSILSVHILFCEVIAILSIMKLNFGLFIAINKAIIWNIYNLQSIIKIRKEINNNIRNKTDSEYFNYVIKKPNFKYFYKLFIGAKSYE